MLETRIMKRNEDFMVMMRTRQKRRRAFTLVEMLVSIALTLFIMVILSSAFTTGIQAFRNLKALGDMEDRLRSTSTILRRDLGAYHFEGLRKLSDPNFWNTTASGGPPQQGFFRIWNGTASSVEGVDGDGIPSTRAVTHTLDFSCKLSGLGPDNFFSASLPGSLATIMNNFPNDPSYNPYAPGLADSRFVPSGTQNLYRSRWAEVVYYLRPTLNPLGVQLTAGSNVGLYTLYRRQLVLLDPRGNFNNADNLKPPTPVNTWRAYYQLSCSATPDTNGNLATSIYFNSPQDLTMPARRFAMNPTSPAGIPVAGTAASPTYPYLGEALTPQLGSYAQDNPSQVGADVLLTDVISFEVTVLTNGASAFAYLQSFGNSNNSVFYDATSRPTAPAVFDTWSSQKSGSLDYTGWATPNTPTSLPMQLNIVALKITMRIWDAKTQQSRQVSIIQEM